MVIDNFQVSAHIAAMSQDFDMDNCADGEQLLRVSEAAARLTVNIRTIWRMIADGELQVVHIRGCTRVYLSSVADYIRKQNRVARV
jgi:excisionase family DNA binding protein